MAPITVTVLAGPAAGSSCTKDAKKIGLGRVKTGNAIALKDDSVSGKHMQLLWETGDWFALDLQSSNGTYLNDSEHSMLCGQTYKLHSGDKLRLGPETVVQVHFEEGASEDMDGNITVEEKLAADVERIAANIMATAETSVQQIRQEWAEKRAELQAMLVRV